MKKIVLTLIFISSVTALYSFKSFRILSRGMVRDNSTNLIWTRCPLTTENKPIYDFQCNGTKKLYTWREALDVCSNLVFEGRTDWRLPSINELQSIAFYYHYVTGEENYSQVVDQVFPNAVNSTDLSSDYSVWGYCTCSTPPCYCHIHYWSSTPVNAGSSWTINFSSGVSQWDTVGKYKSVRCVAGP